MNDRPTFARELAKTVLDNFAGTYYVGTDAQRKPIIEGAAKLIECRMQEVNSGVDKAANPT
jgi:hypothetical protein